MLVYGDALEAVAPRDRLTLLADDWAVVQAAAPGLPRHAALSGLFIAAAELAQGLIDADFERLHADRQSPIQEAAMRLLILLATQIDHSWQNRFASPAAPAVNAAVEALGALSLPGKVSCKRQEGFAFYALYPESYLWAARILPALGDIRVIGIRSIGTALAALVATASQARLAVTARPIGPPFERHVRLAADLSQAVTAGSPDAYAIVDEGPGLSGSSFGAVADFLEEAGVERGRIHFFPSHSGELGPQSSERHRARWGAAPRHVVEFDALMLCPRRPWQGLAAWIGDLAAVPTVRMEEVSGGRWRARRYLREADWPPAHVQQERRKFLLGGNHGETLLMKFVGLGRYGERKFARARALSEAWLVPPVQALRYGFLVERWLDATQPLNTAAIGREHLIAGLARYLGFRARHFVMGRDSGASLSDLAVMLHQNARECIGGEASAAFDKVETELPRLECRMSRVATDNRMHVWEWLQDADGRLFKADAVDHCEAHDLVGCQDIAWDIAGAGVEFELSAEEAADLRAKVEGIGGRPVSPTLVAYLRPCYIAFQLGYYAMAAAALDVLPEEAARLKSRSLHYESLLRSTAISLA